ncbi:MAG: hypothetical protein ACK4YO_03785 [Candidatus Altarchaeaceae archaeon]
MFSFHFHKKVFTEKEIVGFDKEDGKWRTYKPDRIIERENFVEVIDFKIGKRDEEREKKDKEQVINYKKILSEIYKKEIYGYLAYIDVNMNKVDVIEVK